MLQRARDEGIQVPADLEEGLAIARVEGRQARHQVLHLTQTRLDEWVQHLIQYDLDMTYIRFFVDCGVPFNIARSEWYVALHDVYLSQFRGPYRPRRPQYEFLRTTLLSMLYAKLHERLRYHRESWSEGVTFMTDGWSTQANRPLCNYLVAGRLGASLYRVEDMFGRERTEAGLCLRWRELILEIGAKHVAICMDNALANKEAYCLLRGDPDERLCRITWIPCAAHCCNLMPTHIARQSWVAQVIVEGRDITLFFRRHARAAYLLSRQSPTVSLIRSGETQYGTNYIMLQRMVTLHRPLDACVSGVAWATSPWLPALRDGARRCFDLLRDPRWWQQVELVCTIMEPIYELLQQVDSDGQRVGDVWGLLECLRITVDRLTLDEACHMPIKKIVTERSDMLLTPIHCAAYLLHPKYRSIDLLMRGTTEERAQDFHGKYPILAHWGGYIGDASVEEPDFDPVQWWRVRGASHRVLRDIAMRCLGVPATTFAPEAGSHSLPVDDANDIFGDIDADNASAGGNRTARAACGSARVGEAGTPGAIGAEQVSPTRHMHDLPSLGARPLASGAVGETGPSPCTTEDVEGTMPVAAADNTTLAPATFSSPHRAVERDCEGRIRRRPGFIGPLDWSATSTIHPDAERDLAAYLPRPLSDLPGEDPDVQARGGDGGQPVAGGAAPREGGLDREELAHDLAAAGYSTEEIREALEGYPRRDRQGTPQHGMHARQRLDVGRTRASPSLPLPPPDPSLALDIAGAGSHEAPVTDTQVADGESSGVRECDSPGTGLRHPVSHAGVIARTAMPLPPRDPSIVIESLQPFVGRKRNGHEGGRVAGRGRGRGRPPGRGRGEGQGRARGGDASTQRTPAGGRGDHARAPPPASSTGEGEEGIAQRLTKRRRADAPTTTGPTPASSSGSIT
ncbi:hypothetical protein CBR_g23532 [Chara braunii]|uniref:DUF659 domain-containing protein n=1 Tax=Chara braunii TaxID=69332 RepID=A0A388L4G7_CHABU|nr:hypothetical protein CBR_g23532 [Chara braunii]|eukprot:GBG77205.1 hypothetical protein CBR_g23532 [Chara braunii]